MNEDNYTENARQEIIEWEAQGPGFLGQVGDFVLWPVQKAAEALVPEGVQEAVNKAIVSGLRGLSKTSRALVDVSEVRSRLVDLRQSEGQMLRGSDLAAQHYWNWHIAYAAAEGGATGGAGIFGLAADIPGLFTISIRLIQQIATCYDYDISEDMEQEYGLQVLRTGSTGDMKAKLEFLIGLKEVEQILLNVAWKNMNEALARRELSKHAALAALRQFAKSLGVQITKRKALQMVPVVGALIGASFNASFVNDVGRAAYMNYRRRWITEHDATNVESATVNFISAEDAKDLLAFEERAHERNVDFQSVVKLWKRRGEI
jgi:hypothetical protein